MSTSIFGGTIRRQRYTLKILTDTLKETVNGYQNSIRGSTILHPRFATVSPLIEEVQKWV